MNPRLEYSAPIYAWGGLTQYLVDENREQSKTDASKSSAHVGAILKRSNKEGQT
jgi:hypothetical protein